MTHPILFGCMAFFTFASVLTTVFNEDGTKRINASFDALIYGYTAYVLWGI